MKHEIMLEKSEESLKVSDWCYNKKYYANSISRLYYALFQYMTGILLKAGKSLERAEGEESHIKFETEAYNYITEKKLLKNNYDFINDFRSIKNLRVASDYQGRRISKEDCDLAKKIFDKLKQYFK